MPSGPRPSRARSISSHPPGATDGTPHITGKTIMTTTLAPENSVSPITNMKRLVERLAHTGSIDRRFKPTVRHCAATEQRLEQLTKSVANLGDLLLRVQVEMDEQNAEILRSLNARADSQIKIQHAVEGLSIIAITYYLLNPFKMSYLGLHTLGLDVAARTAILFMGPVAAAALLAILFRIHKAKNF
jgi:uncharacterized membrane-anchored protein